MSDMNKRKKKIKFDATWAGFEPTRPKPYDIYQFLCRNIRVIPINHSGTTPIMKVQLNTPIDIPTEQANQSEAFPFPDRPGEQLGRKPSQTTSIKLNTFLKKKTPKL